MSSISVVLPDGSERELPAGTTGAGLADSLGGRAAREALVAVANGQQLDLNRELPDGANVSLVFPDTDELVKFLPVGIPLLSMGYCW